MGNAIADLLFPPSCVACRRPGSWLCAGCLADVAQILPPVCPVCGRPLVRDESAAGCGAGGSHPLHLSGLRAYAWHSGPLREAIHAFKYEGLRALAPLLGRLMAGAWPALAPDEPIDTIVPVPLHLARQRKRGYNQAALLARELAHAMACPLAEGLLIRARATAPQVGLTAAQRQINVAGAFRWRGAALDGRRILLIDDVCTTGATLEQAGVALLQAGAGSVWAYTLARA